MAIVKTATDRTARATEPVTKHELVEGDGVPRGLLLVGGSYGSLAAARSIGRHGVPVAFVSAEESLTRQSRFVTRNINWAGAGAPGAVDLLLGLADEGMAGWVLLPGGDAEVQLITQNYEALAGRFRLVTMPWDKLEAINDKAQLYRLASDLGIAVPAVYEDEFTGTTDAAAMRFPVVIKPASTERPNDLTRAKAWKAETAEEYTQLHARAVDLAGPGGFVVQELVPGDGRTQYSYAGLWNNGTEIAALTARRARQYPLNFGTSPFVETVECTPVFIEARRLLEAVGYHGLVEIEFKHDVRTDQFKILDVNTRIWAWISLGAATGIDFPWLAALLAAGAEVKPVATPVYGATWVHPIRNLLSIGESLLRLGRPGYASGRSLFSRSLWATGSWDDPRPALLELPVQMLRRFDKRRRQ